MVQPNSPKKTSGDSSLAWQIMHISFRLGYLQATANQILAAVTEQRTARTPRRSGRMRERFAKVTIHLRWRDLKELYARWRDGPWGLLGLGLWGLAKWLGVL